MRPRRNQRGPSTPRKRTGSSAPRRPPWTGSAGVIRARSSTPNGPSASALWPPLLATSAAISCLISSHRPPLFGAAKACSCRPLFPCMTVIQAGWLSTALTWISMPSRDGTSRLPKSIRSWLGTSSSASHGPAMPAVSGPASPAPGSGSPGPPSSGPGSSSPRPESVPSGSFPGWPESVRRRRNTVTHSLPVCSSVVCSLAGPGHRSPARCLRGGLPGSVPARGPEATVAACRTRERLHLVQHHARHLLDDQLGDPVAALETDHVVGVGVEQGDPDLATVPRVHGSRRIDQRDAVPRGEPGPRVDEGGVAVGQGDRDPGGDNGPLPGFQPHLGGREQVQPGVAGVRAGRQRQVRIEPPDEHGDVLLHGGEPYRCRGTCSG